MDNLKVLGISMEIKLQNKYRLITLTNDLNKKDIGIVLPKDDIN